MAQVETGGAKTGGPRRRRRPDPRNADTGDTTRSRPAPAKPPTFARPPVEQPFAQQQKQAQRQTVRARNRLPAPNLARPPIVSGQAGRHSGEPMSRAEVDAFLKSQSRITQAARRQIVGSIRANVGDAHGADRVQKLDDLVDEIATNPKLAGTRRAIRYYTSLETRRPETGELKPGPPDRRISGPGPLSFASVNTTAVSRLAADAGGKIAPGLKSADPAALQFAKNAVKDVGLIGSAPFVGGYHTGKAGLDDLGTALDAVGSGKSPLRALTHGETAALAERMGKGVVENWSHPAKYFVNDPLLFALDVSGFLSLVGHGAGAAVRAAGKTGAPGVRGTLAEAGSTVRSPLALGDDLAAGIVERRGSKDLIRGYFQTVSDKARDPLRDASGNIVTVEQAGRQVPVLKAHEGPTIRHPRVGERAALNQNRADVIASRANSQERLDREVEAKDRRVKGVRGRAAKDITSLVTRGVITSAAHMHTDLAKYATKIRGKLAQHDLDVAAGRPSSVYHHEGELEAARRNADLAEKVLRSPKAMAQAEKIVAEGERHGRALVEHDTQAAAAGLFEGGAEQAHRARLVETAVEHMGGRHGRDPRLDTRIANARALERSLQARLNFGHASTPAQRAALQRQIDTTRRMREQITARNTERLRDRHGNPLEPHQIEDFLRSRGRDPETVAYLPPGASQRHYHKQLRPDSRGTLDTPGHVKTGAQAAKGAVENSAEILEAAGVRHATTINKARSIDRLVSEHGMKHPAVAKAARGEPLTKHERRVVARGGYFTGPEAAEAVRRAEARGEHLAAVRAFPGKLDSATQRIIREDLQGPGGIDTLGQRLLNDRFLTEGDLKSRTPNVVLVNGDLIDRLNAHLKPSTSAGKFAQIANRAFRYAVLPQPRWMVGNFFEPLIVRMPGVGSGINVFGLGADLRAGTKAIRAMERSGDPAVRAAAKEIRAHQFGGLLFGSRGLTNRRTLAEVSPAMTKAAEKAYGRMVQRFPATKQLTEMTGTLLGKGGHAVMAPLDLIFNLNRAGESVLQRAAFGKSVRHDIQEFSGSWLETIKLGRAALEDVGKGLTNTPAQQRYLSAQHDLLGKYEGFSPTMRAIIQGPAPFLPYALNAARFVFWTMPAHRSAQTALLARIDRVVEKDWDEIHKGVPKGMQLAIPNGKGGWVDVARYTPYGLSSQIASGDYRGITSQLLPQFSGSRAALEGKDPFGRDLQMSDRQPAEGGDKAAIAGNSFLEAFIPYLSNARRLQEHGETAFSDSTVLSPKSKPGTSHGMSSVRRVLDPFRPTYLNAGGRQEVVVSEPGPAATGGQRRPRATGGVPPSVRRALHASKAGARVDIPPSVRRALHGR